jgi:hypothetical protein
MVPLLTASDNPMVPMLTTVPATDWLAPRRAPEYERPPPSSPPPVNGRPSTAMPATLYEAERSAATVAAVGATTVRLRIVL